MGSRLGLRDKNNYRCLGGGFPLLEKDEELNRFFAKHHPFTSPPEDIARSTAIRQPYAPTPTTW